MLWSGVASPQECVKWLCAPWNCLSANNITFSVEILRSKCDFANEIIRPWQISVIPWWLSKCFEYSPLCSSTLLWCYRARRDPRYTWNQGGRVWRSILDVQCVCLNGIEPAANWFEIDHFSTNLHIIDIGAGFDSTVQVTCVSEPRLAEWFLSQEIFGESAKFITSSLSAICCANQGNWWKALARCFRSWGFPFRGSTNAGNTLPNSPARQVVCSSTFPKVSSSHFKNKHERPGYTKYSHNTDISICVVTGFCFEFLSLASQLSILPSSSGVVIWNKVFPIQCTCALVMHVCV